MDTDRYKSINYLYPSSLGSCFCQTHSPSTDLAISVLVSDKPECLSANHLWLITCAPLVYSNVSLDINEPKPWALEKMAIFNPHPHRVCAHYWLKRTEWSFCEMWTTADQSIAAVPRIFPLQLTMSSRLKGIVFCATHGKRCSWLSVWFRNSFSLLCHQN